MSYEKLFVQTKIFILKVLSKAPFKDVIKKTRLMLLFLKRRELEEGR